MFGRLRNKEDNAAPLHNLQTPSTVNTGNFKTAYNDGSSELRKCLQVYTYSTYYVQNSRGAHPHNQHIQQLPETLIRAGESRTVHNGHLSTATGTVVSAVSKLRTFMQAKGLILRVIIIIIIPLFRIPEVRKISNNAVVKYMEN
jgi:hypothetical protein